VALERRDHRAVVGDERGHRSEEVCGGAAQCANARERLLERLVQLRQLVEVLEF
jgi:hypothetical protein